MLLQQLRSLLSDVQKLEAQLDLAGAPWTSGASRIGSPSKPRGILANGKSPARAGLFL